MRKVMIIDDEKQVLNSLKRNLVRHKWQVFTFDNPETALEYAEIGFFPVVISDYRMPVMNGVDFLRRFQKLHPFAFKIMLSGQADQKALCDAINFAGIDRFLHKPWNGDQLLREIELGLNSFKKQLDSENSYRKQNLSKEEYLAWHEELLEQASPGITKVKKNPMGWIEINQ